ncbi:hypothetical protein Tco_1203048 [Tanacetum coccineum]
MTTPTNNNQMHNDIMAAGSKEQVTISAKPATTTEDGVPEHNVLKTYKNTTPEKRAYIDAEVIAIHMIFSGIGDDIYSITGMQLTLVAATQQYPDDHYQAPKPRKTYASSSKQTPSTRSYAATRNKGKEIFKPITPLSESASNEDSDEEQAQRDKHI